MDGRSFYGFLSFYCALTKARDTETLGISWPNRYIVAMTDLVYCSETHSYGVWAPSEDVAGPRRRYSDTTNRSVVSLGRDERTNRVSERAKARRR